MATNSGISPKPYSKKIKKNDYMQYKYKINGNVEKPHTEGSEYKSDLEDKLQIYNKINGAIRRHFGKTNEQRNKVKNSQHYS